jgi:ParB family chromosome partitioning protein
MPRLQKSKESATLPAGWLAALPHERSFKVEWIEIKKIAVGTRMRALSESHIEELKISIKLIGIINPLIVTEKFRLVAGRHRLAACEQLGWGKVPVILVADNKLLNEQEEIDENLFRVRLTALERGEHLKRGKEIFKQLAEEARTQSDQERNYFAGTTSYAEFAAQQSATTRRSIQQEIRIATLICQEAKDLIRDQSFADRKVDLLRLCRIGHEDQIKVAKVINAGVESLDDAFALLTSTGEPVGGYRCVKSPQAKGLEKLLQFASQGLSLEDFPDAVEVDFIFQGCADFTQHIVRALHSILHRLGHNCETKQARQRPAEDRAEVAPPLLQLIATNEAHK